MRVIFGLTVLGGIGLLVLAVWPGLVEDLVFGFPFIAVFVPLLGFWFLLLVGPGLHDLTTRQVPPNHRRWGLAAAGIMFATLGMLWVHIPQRLAFAFCFAELRELVDGAAVNEFRGRELDRRVGPYHVDRYGADSRGGVFFRTATGPDGIGPDQMSYGFAFRPNGRGSPFGNARYRQRHLFGDWYTFTVSDDS